MIRKYLNFNDMAPNGVVIIPGRRGPFTKRSAVNLATRHTVTKTVRIRPDIAAHRVELARAAVNFAEASADFGSGKFPKRLRLVLLPRLAYSEVRPGDRRKRAKMARTERAPVVRVSHRQAKLARMAHLKEGAK